MLAFQDIDLDHDIFEILDKLQPFSGRKPQIEFSM